MINNGSTSASHYRQDNELAVLLDALDIVVISDTERASLTELAGFRRPPWIHRCR